MTLATYTTCKHRPTCAWVWQLTEARVLVIHLDGAIPLAVQRCVAACCGRAIADHHEALKLLPDLLRQAFLDLVGHCPWRVLKVNG